MSLAALLAKHFKLVKKDLIDSVDIESDDPLFFEPLSQFNFDHPLHVGRLSTISLSNFFNGSKFERGSLMAEFLAAESTLKDEYATGFILAVTVNSDIFFFYRANGYKGEGGLFLRTPNQGCFVFEPAKNFLNYRFPDPDKIDLSD